MNKYLISVIVPIGEFEYDIYIPNNKKIGTIKTLILKSLSELSNSSFNKQINEVRMIDRDTGIEYENNMYVKDSGIKNGSKIIIIWVWKEVQKNARRIKD